MENEKAVADFLSDLLKRREDARQRQEDETRRLSEQFVQTNRANLSPLLATWRSILVTRAASFTLAVTALQYILQNITSFIGDGRQSAVVMIILAMVCIDTVLAHLENRCAIRGLQAERYLNVKAQFFEIDLLDCAENALRF